MDLEDIETKELEEEIERRRLLRQKAADDGEAECVLKDIGHALGVDHKDYRNRLLFSEIHNIWVYEMRIFGGCYTLGVVEGNVLISNTLVFSPRFVEGKLARKISLCDPGYIVKIADFILEIMQVKRLLRVYQSDSIKSFTLLVMDSSMRKFHYDLH